MEAGVAQPRDVALGFSEALKEPAGDLKNGFWLFDFNQNYSIPTTRRMA
jgi:hypothetical protein